MTVTAFLVILGACAAVTSLFTEAVKKLLTSKTGYKKTMKIKKV